MSSNKAMAAVAKAVKSGDLNHISTMTCVDCGNKADGYDHRDYFLPLNVEPVCDSCNQKRGPAMGVHDVGGSNTKIIRVNARISVKNKNKLMQYCKDKGITLSQWVTLRIELMRYK